MAAPSVRKEETINGIDKWKVEDDLNTCLRYAEVMRDPKRKKAVAMLATKKMGTLKKVAEGK